MSSRIWLRRRTGPVLFWVKLLRGRKFRSEVDKERVCHVRRLQPLTLSLSLWERERCRTLGA